MYLEGAETGIGHYKNIVNKDYYATGFAFLEGDGDGLYKGYRRFHGQTFDFESSEYTAGAENVNDYEEKFLTYYNQVKSNIQEAQDALDNAESANAVINEKIEEAQTQLNSLKTQLETLEEEKTVLDEEYANAQHRVAAAECWVWDASHTLADAREVKEQADAELAEAQKVLEEARTALNAKQVAKDKLQKETDDLQTQLNTKQTELDALLQKKAELLDTDKLQAKVDAASRDLEEARKVRDAALKDLDEKEEWAKDILAKHEAGYPEVKEQIDALEEEIKELEEKLEKAKADRDEIQICISNGHGTGSHNQFAYLIDDWMDYYPVLHKTVLAMNESEDVMNQKNAELSDAKAELEAAKNLKVKGSDDKKDEDKTEKQGKAMYRMYNPNSSEHFYTSNEVEKNKLVSLGWKYEGVGWTAPAESDTPVYRLYNPNAGDHHYTTSAHERDVLKQSGWNYEGIGWYSESSEAQKVYRLYNPNATGAGAHHYTTNYNEYVTLESYGWKQEGIGWYGMK